MTTSRTALTWTAAAVLLATTSACSAANGAGASESTAPVTASVPVTDETSAASQPDTMTSASPTLDPSARPADAAPTEATRLPEESAQETLQTATPTDTEPTESSSTATPSTSASASATTSSASPSTASEQKMLRVGDSGAEVTALQQQLLDRGFWLPKADGEFGAITQQAVFAAQKTYGLPRTGLAGPLTRKALAGPGRPTATSTSGKVVEIDIARQTLTLVDNGTVKAVLNTSTGSGEDFESEGVKYVAVTPAGTYKVQSRNPNGWVTGPLGDMYKPVFFNGGIAFHGSAEIPPYPASHGCARLSKSAQDYVWKQGYTSVGTTVVVR